MASITAAPAAEPAAEPKVGEHRRIASRVIERLVPELMQRHHTPGVSIALIEDAEVVATHCFGTASAASEKPVGPETVFEACSMSKPLCAYSALKLVTDGRLELDRPLVEYLKQDYLDDEPRHRQITARMVLQHTTGMPNWRAGGWRSGGPISLNFDPDSQYGYSGEGFLFLQRAIEAVIEEPFADWVRRELLIPSGLKRTSYAALKPYTDDYAAGHDRDGQVIPRDGLFEQANAAYTLTTTPAEYAQFLTWLMATDRQDAFQIDAKWIHEMLQPAVPTGEPGQWRGLGWVVTRNTFRTDLSHSGSNGTGFRCNCRFDVQNRSGIVIMTNSLAGAGVWEELMAALESTDSGNHAASKRPRARDVGLQIGLLEPGRHNAITDVPGVLVGHATVREREDIRTGVTIVRPHRENMFRHKVPAAIVVGNGFGKLVGSTQVNELGTLETPIALTSTLSVFRVADALIDHTLQQAGNEQVRSVNPVVGETNDGFLNDIQGRHVTATHVQTAIAAAESGPVVEGCVGAGTGTRCLGFKGGIGTASRRLAADRGGYHLGVLVQSNFGGSLTVNGARIGDELGAGFRGVLAQPPATPAGSCMIVVATDAPVDARQLRRIGTRALLGLGAMGSPMSHGSGDYVIAFTTQRGVLPSSGIESVPPLADDQLTPLFQAAREATEEAILNSILKATTTTGRSGHRVEAIPINALLEACRKHQVLAEKTGE